MRVVVVSGLALVVSVVAWCQTAPPAKGPVHAIESSAPVSGKPPAVFWKRGMTVPPKPPEPLPADVEPMPAIDPAPSPTAPKPVPLILPMIRAAAPVPARPRAALIQAVAALEPGATRGQVIEKLGPALYAVGIPDGSHYIERLRYRSGSDFIAAIELRDGIVTHIEKPPPGSR